MLLACCLETACVLAWRCLGAAWALLRCCLGSARVLFGRCCMGAACLLLGRCLGASTPHNPTHKRTPRAHNELARAW
eukprot:11219994-Lingulodinium_polyedra.AAC.1